jgi:hypothetical protein
MISGGFPEHPRHHEYNRRLSLRGAVRRRGNLSSPEDLSDPSNPPEATTQVHPQREKKAIFHINKLPQLFNYLHCN